MYTLPSQRNKTKPPPRLSSPELVCKWCHEVGHLSINCKFKGTILQKKPQLCDTDTFPKLGIESVEPPTVKWKRTLSNEQLKNLPAPAPEKKIMRINSSNISLDTLTSNDSMPNDMLHNRTTKDIHPYNAYYSLKNSCQITKLMEVPEFLIHWYCQEHYRPTGDSPA